jgi:hypothetical protein
MKVHILTKGFRSFNGLAFAFPLILNADRLKDLGISLRFFGDIDKSLPECDYLIVESKFTKSWWTQKERLFEALTRLKTASNKVLFFDLGDGTASWCLGVLPYVDGFYKSYLFKDRSRYLESYYGGRIWTDYYHRQFQIDDVFENRPPPVTDAALLEKIHLGYCAGLSNYALSSLLYNNSKLVKAIRRCFGLAKWGVIGPSERDFCPPSAERELALSCRVTTRYSETVSYQRKRTVEILKDYLNHERVNKCAYFDEMRRAKAVLSPFGWGEINYKDYEVAHCGAVLMKPDIGHLETWPLLFDERSVLQYRWDFADLPEKVEDVIRHYGDYLEYAFTLQNRYKRSVATAEGQEEFCRYFKQMLANTP